MGRVFAGILAVLGWLSLILQFVLAMTNPVTPEPGSFERFVRYFSYFTVSTNIIVAVTLTAIAFSPQTVPGRFFKRPTVQAAVTSYISIVGIIYSLFLRTAWNPEGWQAVADHALHDVVPVAFVIYWVGWAPKGGLGWLDPFKWLVYPAIYIAYSLTRGAIVSWYPYWFVDVTKIGYLAALTNTAIVFAAFAVTGFICLTIAKLLSRTAIPSTT